VLADPDDIANNNTTIRITKTYDNAILATPLLDILTVPNEYQEASSASFVLKGTINTLQTIINQLPGITNTSAVMNSFIGNGTSTGPIMIPNSIALESGDSIVLRKNTSDGSFKPSDIQYDTQIFGGDFSYRSATGITPEDINIDGDGFVTPMTSHAPEEVVTGQVVDTVDITVYDKISDGAPIIETVRHLIVDGVSAYNIEQLPGTSSSVLVKVNNLVITQDVDYTVNFKTQQVELVTQYVPGDELVITSLSQNGLNILDLDYFIADGNTTEFISVARWNDEVTVFVTLDGEATDVAVFKTDNTYELVGNIGIKFNTAPAVDVVINYTILGSAVDSISKVQKQTIVHTGQRNDYTLTRSPAFDKPYADNVLVVHDGMVLRPSDTIYFAVSGNSRTYYIDSAKYGFNTVDSSVVTVAVNGVAIIQSVDYFWFPVNNQLKIKQGVAKSGDKVALSINLNSDYIISEDGAGTTIEFLTNYPANSITRVITFSNHDILEIERNHDLIKSATVLTPGMRDYYNFNQLAGGRIKLRRPALASQYVWITLNRQLLTPNTDYALESNMNYIVFSSNITFLETDIVDVVAFSNKVTRASFGYKIFKDMLNKNSYTRIDDASSTNLANDLHFYDSTITVENASMLSVPSANLNKPGVIFINGERIEYLRKEGNVLRQLRRGTLGTGVKLVHAVGSLVRDQSVIQTVPYKDEYITSVTVSDGYNLADSIYTNSPSVTVSSIVFAGEDQTAGPLGNDLVTVTGTGFRINVRLFVGDVECSVNRISDTTLTFATPAKTIGAYDLVIYNPPITIPSTVTTPIVSGTVAAASATTFIDTTSSILGILRVGMLITVVGTDTGNVGTRARITQINSPTRVTIKAESSNTFGSLTFTGTETVKVSSIRGTITATSNPLVSTVTLSGTYDDIALGLTPPFVTSGFAVGVIVSKIEGTGSFGADAIITNVAVPAAGNDPLTFTVTSTSANSAGSVVFNINNQNPTSFVSSGAIKYLKIPLNFTPIVSANDSWYKNTIPVSYGQCDDIEVFVAGRRLRKAPYTLWNPNATATQIRATDGDIKYEAEFSVNGGAFIRLTDVLDAGQYVVVQKRVGRTWVPDGATLAESATEPARFIKSSYALLPDKNKV